MSSKFFPPIFLVAMILLVGGCGSDGGTLPGLQGDIPGEGYNLTLADGSMAVTGVEPGPVAYSDVRELPRYLDGEVLVVLVDGADPQVLYPMAKGLGLSLAREIRLMWGTVYRMKIDTGESVESMVAKLKGNPEVRFAEPNYIYYPCEVPYYPNDHLFEYPGDPDNDPWSHMYDQWGPNVLGASLVWPHGKGDPDTIVGVLDTGYRYTHEDLANQIWINTDEIPGNGIDDDENGYIDDWRGWDFWYHDNDPMDSYGHGTACSGVVAAEQDNGVGCTGIAPGCKVMALRCNLEGGGSYTSTVIEGTQYAYDNGADVLSMSFRSYDESDIMHQTFIAAWDDGNGLLPVGGAGNENSSDECWPGSWPEVLRVGGTCSFYTNNTRRDVTRIVPQDYGWGSSWGATLEIMAPGDLYVTTHVGSDTAYYDGGFHGTFGGTSNATPVIAGCAGLLKSFHPEMSASELRERLKETSDDLYTPGWDDQTGWGRVNIWRAIFGSEPNSASYDGNGHLPIEADDTWQYDNIFDISTSADYDFEDIFVIQSGLNGVLRVELDIITTGENLDIEIYDSPELMSPIAASYGPNGSSNPTEELSGIAEAGANYYIRVFSPEEYNCSNFRIRAEVEEFRWWVDWESIAPHWVFNQSPGVPLLKLVIQTNLAITLTDLFPYVTGDIPLDLVNNFRLYEDTNSSGGWEDGVDDVIAVVNTPDVGINQLSLKGLGLHSDINKPLTLFIVADVGPTNLGYLVYFGGGLRTYKDITIAEHAKLVNDPFPILSDLVALGEDHDPPVWDTTTGLQNVFGGYKAAVLYWNNATEDLSIPVHYNVYWTDEDPPDILTANKIEAVSFWNGGDYDHAGQVADLENDKTYFFLVRAEDASYNEDDNLVWLDAIPSGTSDPEHPQVIGEINLGDNAEEVWVHDKIAYVACNDAGLAIIDCHIPTAPVLIDTYPGGNCRAVQYYSPQDYVYIANSSGLVILDPDGSSGPEVIGSYSAFGAREVYVDADICCVGAGGNVIVLDVSDPANPEYRGGYNIGGGFWQRIYGLIVRDGYAYVSTRTDGFYIIDISDPTDPTLAQHLSLSNDLFELDIMGDYAFLTQRNDSILYVVDISDPPNAFQAGQIDVQYGQGRGVAVRDMQYVYFGMDNGTLHSIRWDDLDNLQIAGGTETDYPYGLFYDGEFLYSAEEGFGFKILL